MNTFAIGYCGMTADGMMGPTVETEMQALEAFFVEYPAVPEGVIRVRTITASDDHDEEDKIE